MPKAGLFAAEITEQAPADGAVTSKPKGYHWMEFGNIFAPTSVESTVDGIASTQHTFETGPDFSHPFAGDSFNEFTMSFIGKLNTLPSGPSDTTNSNAFNLLQDGTGFRFNTARYSGILYMNMVMAANVSGYDEVSRKLLNINAYGWNSWWWFGASYQKATASRTYWGVNLDTGVELQATGITGSNIDIDFFPAATSNGTADSFCHWGLNTYSSALSTIDAAWKGYLSQIYIHSKYVDFDIASNRRKFCSTDGAVSYGLSGEIPLGEQPLVYLPNGHPSSNVGSKFIGTWDSDFFINPAITAGAAPPTGT